MQENEIKLHARLAALEYVLIQVAKTAYLTAGLNEDHFRMMRENARAKLNEETFPGIDPSLSDHIADEIATEVESLFSAIEEVAAAALNRRSDLEG